MKNEINLSKQELINLIFQEDKNIEGIFSKASSLKELRSGLFDYVNRIDRILFSAFPLKSHDKKHIIEKNNAKECIRIFKNIVRSENEQLSKFSTLDNLYKIYKRDVETIESTGNGFLVEILFLIRGINCNSGLSRSKALISEEINSKVRGKTLDKYSQQMLKYFKRFRKGTDKYSVRNQEAVKKRILEYFSATEKDWSNYKWHLDHIISDCKTLSELIKLEPDEIEGIKSAEENSIPIQITPYYLTLFNMKGRDKHDRLVRAQVIPSKEYCQNVAANRTNKTNMDFMGEQSTSPIHGITRRYPNIVILKPFDSCPQICVYCQRNWEIKDINDTSAKLDKLENAINWIKRNKFITEVLVTGGDPLTLDNDDISSLLEKLNKIKHIERIRIGTRTLVTLPSRFNDVLIKTLKKFSVFGEKEICIMTHFEDASEVTSDVIKASKKLNEAGIRIYNQQVFTYYNSTKYRTCFLRKTLKLSGIDPYYSFNTKGKAETIDFRVPIARIEQERKEEARLLPGVVRTDEPVFNVPKLGKSHLRSWQEHEVIMILQDGSRIYRFFPWESRLLLVDDYLYTDVPIFDYLKRLEKDGENIEDYKRIWYYF